MYHYEEFIMEIFPKVRAYRENSELATNKVEVCKQKAIRFLEMNCSTLYGFSSEIHFEREGVQKSVGMIPSIYDTAFLLPILLDVDNGIHPSVIKTMQDVIQSNRRESGCWNYILKTNDFISYLCPDDIDDTSLAIMGLYGTGKMSYKECQGEMLNILNNVILSEEGVIGAWLSFDKSENNRQVIYKTLQSRPRVCVGSIVNFLWCLANFELDNTELVNPSVNYVGRFIDSLIETEGTEKILDGMVYYTNRFFIYYLISRYIRASEVGRNLFGGKFALLLQRELLRLEISQDTIPLDIPCIILAAMQMGLHKTGGQIRTADFSVVFEIRRKILKLFEVLPTQQNDDGSFSIWNVYHWYRIGEYVGSKSFSTAMVLSAICTVQREIICK